MNAGVARYFKLTVAYDGTGFSGWQVQPNQRTIQGHLQDALKRLTGEQTQVVGSGRTDAGVHAHAQVASCSLVWRDSAQHLLRALNTQLPGTIVVHEAVDACQGFHAIRDAISKRYRYQLQVGGVRDAFDYRYRWHLHGELDLDQMRLAAQRLVGIHDFKSFQAAGGERKTTVRNVRACELIASAMTDDDACHLSIEVEADGFLYNMVRTIVGTLVEVGRGKQTVEWIDQVLAACDRDAAGPTAPACGLFLKRVDYPDSVVRSYD
ncbi:tRNA pseudouridine(38-40) synthase TruA [bacterium]|nr:tRNA pseudouridine(38-40) synthase TruA [bacterium]